MRSATSTTETLTDLTTDLVMANNNNNTELCTICPDQYIHCVKIFCYLGDTLDGVARTDLAATARIRNGWMKFRELLPFLTSRAPPLEMKGRVYASCVRSSMTYGSETMPLLVHIGLKFERAEMQIIRCMCISMKDKGHMKN